MEATCTIPASRHGLSLGWSHKHRIAEAKGGKKGMGEFLQYTVIGWAGFVVDQYDGNGNHGSITGHFTRFIAQGIQGSGGTPGYGTWNVQLVE